MVLGAPEKPEPLLIPPLYPLKAVDCLSALTYVENCCIHERPPLLQARCHLIGMEVQDSQYYGDFNYPGPATKRHHHDVDS